MSTSREISRQDWLERLLRWVVAIEGLVYFGAALLHLGVHIPLGLLVLAVPNTILPAAIVETILGIAAAGNFVVLMRATASLARITLFIHLFLFAGVLLGMVSLALRVGPPPRPDWSIHYVMLAAIVTVLFLLAIRRQVGRASQRGQEKPGGLRL